MTDNKENPLKGVMERAQPLELNLPAENLQKKIAQAFKEVKKQIKPGKFTKKLIESRSRNNPRGSNKGI
jgi:hypothetical protein